MDETEHYHSSTETNDQRKRLTFTPEILDDLEARRYLAWSHLLTSGEGPMFQELSRLLDTQQARQLVYHARYGLEIPKCRCGVRLSWHNDRRRYRDYCSRTCTASYSVDRKKAKNLATMGQEWHTQTADWRQKIKATNQKRFGVDHYSQTEEFKQRAVQTCLEKFGVEHPAQSKSIREKMRNTNLARYGVTNAAQSAKIKQKMLDTNLAKYGVANAASRHISQSARLFLQDPDQIAQSCQTKTVREIADEHGISVKPIYDRVKLWGISLPTWGASTMEHQIRDFISQHYTNEIVINDRSLLSNQEIDIWLPELKLAIECNGTYWHCESQGRGPEYHLNKTLKCQEKNIDLVHIWEHDWIYRRDIVKSMLMYRLGACTTIPARKLKIVSLSTQQCRAFMEQNHLQGWTTGAKICIGLATVDGNILSAMALGQDRFGKTSSWELLRFASSLCYVIPGAASKLLKYFISSCVPERIISYSDRATTKGGVYSKMGFVLSHYSRPNYRYTQDYMKFYSRNRFQKHRLPKLLKKFDQDQTEWQNMRNNGWDRLWDCGNAVYVWNQP